MDLGLNIGYPKVHSSLRNFPFSQTARYIYNSEQGTTSVRKNGVKSRPCKQKHKYHEKNNNLHQRKTKQDQETKKPKKQNTKKTKKTKCQSPSPWLSSHLPWCVQSCFFCFFLVFCFFGFLVSWFLVFFTSWLPSFALPPSFF